MRHVVKSERISVGEANRLYRDEFDQWFKGRVAEVTGVDLNNPPPGPLSEQLSSYEA